MAFGEDSKSKVAIANVLMVGAGGIGCELVKTLVLSGFRKITMVDMDTIEISNLNRQFLFRKRHVGQSKAKVAAETVQSFCPDAQITTMQDNVKESKFDVAFIKSFNLVLNGLDNDEARRHVNRLCLAANVPLVESGTTGYKGQVTVHVKGVSSCYECQGRPRQQGFPICTIRNTPEKPVHCIVWAKELLFERLFGPPDAITDLDERQAAGDDTAPGETAGEPDASEFVRGPGEGAWVYARRIFDMVYNRDIVRVAGIKALWEQRPPPVALPPAADLLPGLEEPTGCPSAGLLKHLQLNPRQEWSVADTARVFICALYLFHSDRPGDVGQTSFTKDDDLSVSIVAAASNLRAHCYGIPRQSEFDAKGMAGNIIHAIATTNAIVSGYIVIEALKLLNDRITSCRPTFLTGVQPNQYGKVAVTETLPPANPACIACGEALACLMTDTAAFTFGALVDRVLKGHMAFNHPSVLSGAFLYEEGDDLDEDEVAENAGHLPKALKDLPGGGLVHGSEVTVTDQTQNMTVTLLVQHQVIDSDKHSAGFVLEGGCPVPKSAPHEAEAAQQAAPEADALQPSSSKGVKRKGEPLAAPAQKHGRTAVIDIGDDDDTIVLD